jgi:hypothetical protein
MAIMGSVDIAFSNATQLADDALAQLSDIASDNKLTAVEKQFVKKEWDTIVSEKPTLESQADTYGITIEKTSYGTAYNTLNTYITPLLASLITTSDIVGTTFRQNFKDYYDKRTLLLKKITDSAKVEVGGRNLFLDSYLQRVGIAGGSTISKTTSSPTNLIKATYNNLGGTNFGFLHASADRKINYKQDLNYTLSFEIRGNITSLNYVYMMRNSAEGVNSAFTAQSVSLSDTEWTKVVFTKKAPWATNTGYLLIGSQDVASGKWFEARNVKLEQGNIATDWTPAPEDVNSAISGAQQSADGKNRVFYQNMAPEGTFINGDLWFDTDNDNTLSVWDGSGWSLSPFGDAAISNLDAGSITTGILKGIKVEAIEFAGESLSLTGMLSFPYATTETEITGMNGRYTITEPYASYNSKILDGTWHLTSSSIGFKAKVVDQKDNEVYYGTSYFGATLVKLRAYTTSSNNAYDGNFTILNNRLDMSPGKFTMGQSGSSTDPDWPDNIKITADGTIIAIVKIQSGNVYLNGGNSVKNDADSLFLTGKGGATLDIGQDGTGTRVQSADVYNRTYSSPANVYVTELGTIGRSTSARKYKLDEEPIISDLPSKLVEVIPKTWYDKTASEAYSDLLTREMNGENIDWSVEDIPYIERIPGLIAEDVEAAGLSQFVVYSDPDENGVRQVEGLMYDRLWTLLIPLIKELRERVTVLEGGMV